MADLPSPFKTPEGEAEYMAAYEATMRLWPVPYEPVQVRDRFGSTYLVVTGPSDGPPLVMLHCYFTSLTSWVNNIADLSRHYRVYAPDMMGQPGKSVPLEAIRTRGDMAEWLTGVFDRIGVHHADLIGYSYGGLAALNYAICVPERVKRLVLLSPVGGLLNPSKQFYIRGAANTFSGAFLPALTPLIMRSLFHWMFYRPNLQDPRIRPVAECVYNQMVLATKHFRAELLSGKNFVGPFTCTDQELQSVKAKTLLLIGELESLYNVSAALARARRLIPHVDASVIAGAAHDLPVTRAEIVDQRILEFLS